MLSKRLINELPSAPTGRRAQARWRRERLLDAALATFVDNGIDGATVKDITAAAGVTQGMPQIETDIDAAFTAGFWDEFRKRFNAETLLSVSLPVIAGDTALIYQSRSCDGLCGEGFIVKLVRDGKRWKIVDRYSLWVS